MTQKEAIEKLARILCRDYGNDPLSTARGEGRPQWTFYSSQAGMEFRRMVNERACANVIANGCWGGSKPWFEFPNQTAIQDTIALIEQLEE